MACIACVPSLPWMNHQDLANCTLDPVDRAIAKKGRMRPLWACHYRPVCWWIHYYGLHMAPALSRAREAVELALPIGLAVICNGRGHNAPMDQCNPFGLSDSLFPGPGCMDWLAGVSLVTGDALGMVTVMTSKLSMAIGACVPYWIRTLVSGHNYAPVLVVVVSSQFARANLLECVIVEQTRVNSEQGPFTQLFVENGPLHSRAKTGVCL